MGFDDTFRQFMDKFQMPDFSAVDWKGSVDRLRQQFYVASRAIERDAPEMANISLITIPGPGGPMKARIYTPLGAGIPPGPGIIFFHGGGFVLGGVPPNAFAAEMTFTAFLTGALTSSMNSA